MITRLYSIFEWFFCDVLFCKLRTCLMDMPCFVLSFICPIFLYCTCFIEIIVCLTQRTMGNMYVNKSWIQIYISGYFVIHTLLFIVHAYCGLNFTFLRAGLMTGNCKLEAVCLFLKANRCHGWASKTKVGVFFFKKCWDIFCSPWN